MVRELERLGHDVLFLEQDVPWYANSRDLADPPFGTTKLYSGIDELRTNYGQAVRTADCVIVGSYVQDGVAVGEWVTREARGLTAFYDIDTPVTLAKLERGDREYLTPELIPRYGLYLSFTGGPVLDKLEDIFGSPAARALYCSFDEQIYYPEPQELKWDLGYMGTYSGDRQPTLEKLLIEPARELKGLNFVVAGPQYPDSIDWPSNVERIEHLPPSDHRRFYNSQRFTLNVTRSDMINAGYSPSVRLFEAAACGVPIISDHWNGIDTFFTPGEEILIARSVNDVLGYINNIGEHERRSIAERARQRVLSRHTAAHRARELESYILEAMASRRRSPITPASEVSVA